MSVPRVHGRGGYAASWVRALARTR
jgi:hypothetical protein